MNNNQQLEIKGDGYTLLKRHTWDGDAIDWVSPHWSVRASFCGTTILLSTRSPHKDSAHQFAALLLAECQRQSARGKHITATDGKQLPCITLANRRNYILKSNPSKQPKKGQ